MSSESGPSSLEMCVRSLRGLDGVVRPRDVAVRVSWPLANRARCHLCSHIGVCPAGSHQDQNSTGRLSRGSAGRAHGALLPCPALHSVGHRWAPGEHAALGEALLPGSSAWLSPGIEEAGVWGPGGGLSLPPVPPLALQPWLRVQLNDLQSALHSGQRNSFQMQP